MCAVSSVVHTSKISSCQKQPVQFSCGCEQFFTKVGPLVFLLEMFVITENIMKHPVCKFGNKRRADSFALLFPPDITFNSRVVINSKSVVIQVF